MTVAPQPLPVVPAASAAYRATTAQHLITIALAWWLWAACFWTAGRTTTSASRSKPSSLPGTPSFTAALSAVAGWCLYLAWRGWQLGRRGLAAFPDGYGLAAIGVPLFGVGGIGDLIWHTVFGIEVGIEALLSPTHLLLFAGGSLIVASPLNAAWQSVTPRLAPLALRWVAVLSATSVLALTAFIHMYMWGLMSIPQGLGWVQTRGELSAVLLTALMLAAPVLLLLRRFALPFGAITVMYTLTNTAMALMLAPGDWRVPGVALVCGLLADVLCVLLHPSPARVWAFRAFAFCCRWRCGSRTWAARCGWA